LLYSLSFFFFFIFFFSSRRRHTRWPRDWSSDVCSSDLVLGRTFDAARVTGGIECAAQDLSRRTLARGDTIGQVIRVPPEDRIFRSEERRVGKECRAWVWREHEKKKRHRVGGRGYSDSRV